ncbi:MAG: NgoBV family restriction endonuclease [Saprospiraceae bacterium]
MKLNAEQLFQKLTQEYGLVGQKGVIKFTLKDLSIEIESRDSVGNLVQEWLKAWMKQAVVEFEEGSNTQTFPDIFLDKEDKKKGLLEIKTFDADRGPGFDLANFESYCNSLLTNAYRLDSDYLVIAYRMEGTEITIQNVWLKKIWELTGGSSTYPMKVQEKKKIIYNIRPIIWYSERVQFKPFESKEAFLAALNETRYKYPVTRYANAHWLDEVLKNYAAHTGISLTVNS